MPSMLKSLWDMPFNSVRLFKVNGKVNVVKRGLGDHYWIVNKNVEPIDGQEMMKILSK